MKQKRWLLVTSALFVALTGCGGGGGGGAAPPPPAPNPTYTVGGTVAGLAVGTSVTLENGSGNELVVGTNGSFAFASAVTTGTRYSVTAVVPPVGRRCVVTNGAGMVLGTNVTGITVNCASPDNWVTNGNVFVSALSPDGSTVYIGGDFNHVGPRTGSFVGIDSTSGTSTSSLPKVDGQVYASAHDGAGGWYIGGTFSNVGGTPRQNIAHILSNGRVDHQWNPGADRTVHALAVWAGTVYAGGEFTVLGALARNKIGAVDAAGVVSSWSPNAGSTVYSLAVDAGSVYVGGEFQTIGGQPRGAIARIDRTTGSALAWNPSAIKSNGIARVRAILLAGTTLYVGGEFDSLAGQTRNNIGALDSDTGSARTWNPIADNAVWALATGGAEVYVGGSFASIGGQARNRIAALSATTGIATAWNPDANAQVSALQVIGGNVIAGGVFISIGGQARNFIAALDATTGLATSWNPNANNAVSCLLFSGNTVYAGGSFSSVGGQTRNSVAALSAATGVLTPWNPDASSNGGQAPVYALAATASSVYVGGSFTAIGGQARSSLAALDASTGLANSWNPDVNGIVQALATTGTRIYVGGNFSTIGGQPRRNLAALDLVTGAAIASAPNPDGTVSAIAIDGSTVFVGGGFSSIGGQSRNRIAALDATSGNATTWNPNATAVLNAGEVKTLAVSGTTIYVGGLFDTIGLQTRRNIAAIDTATGSATAWAPVISPNSFVLSVAVSGTTVYVGGILASVGGQLRSNIAALDSGTGLATAWNPNASAPVRSLVVTAGTVYVGGSFGVIGGEAQSGFAYLASQ